MDIAKHWIAELSPSAWIGEEPAEWSLGAEHQEIGAEQLAEVVAEPVEIALSVSGQRPGLSYRFFTPSGGNPFAVASAEKAANSKEQLGSFTKKH